MAATAAIGAYSVRLYEQDRSRATKQRTDAKAAMTLEDQTFIEASPERVFDFLQHLGENCMAWHPDHLACRWTKGKGFSRAWSSTRRPLAASS